MIKQTAQALRVRRPSMANLKGEVRSMVGTVLAAESLFAEAISQSVGKNE